MRKAVVDNTVFVSFVALRGPGASKLMDAWEAKRFQLITSEPILAEADIVLRQQGASDEAVDTFLSGLRTAATVVAPTERITACRDADDDKMLEAAVAGHADCIVSGDKDLRVLSPFRGLEILTVNRFLRRLGVRKATMGGR